MNPPDADVTQFMLGFAAGEATFFAVYAVGKFRTRKIVRETRRSRNLRAVERFMFECDVLLWGIKP